MQVYNKGSYYTHIFNYLSYLDILFIGLRFFKLQPLFITPAYELRFCDCANYRAFTGHSSLRGSNDSTGISTGVPGRSTSFGLDKAI